ncbi:thioredoxin family protein [Chromobacterium violaceum]|uniref:Probable thiol-disulfide isomerase and thioredoxin n=1 Tax=Chromobacterium violaceum (strain ATCC 12472 / DSM 30191 / JCM 1249 / CCUG 213 / NBRC 12614 / NCIMB 9131 / NCTC 9757 / MK) TaxID=243365 RepID=Q7NYE9_CHRVO|nr:thioredoxin family protein [Chromobacterium violaceum]AAQ59000.1 probable thiol-disulfide isomerase and thioredoxin [Chromobacterium violaceum ATCC 12472]SUX88832.1 Thiol:disulfide interchange protein [Chromobacterium violaceum]
MKKLLILLSLWLASAAALAGDLPYDELADAKAELSRTLDAAKQGRQPVLLILGANWCPDCRALDAALNSGKSAELLAREFKVVKVDVGNFDHNLDIDAEYGHPIAKGIPAAVVLSPDNKVVYATRAGELADARRMSETGIYEFFERVSRLGLTSQ